MDVLEQVQRERAGAVEEQHVALLRVVEIGAAQRLDQRPDAGLVARAGQGVGGKRRAQFRAAFEQVGLGIGEQGGQDPECVRHCPSLR